MGLVEFLNENSGAFAVIFSAVVAIATVVYAILTWRLVSETRKMREAQTEPKVSVTIQPREEWINLIDMVIQNIGLGPAYNIKFEINPDFEYMKGKFLSELGFMKNGLKYLAPNQKLQFFLTIENFEEKTKKSFEIRVTYQNSIGKTYKDVYTIDFSQLIGLSQLGEEPPLYKIAKNVEEIKKDIHHLSTGFHKIKVIRYTKEDVEEETKQLLERSKQPKKEDEV
ncbi:MAG: hypothetical protein J7J46_07180 [Candidatus Desulfofervidus sp.]|nr:hypothetical protein [Candidatus Desulfofervidus sp.]